jgi:signal transduction histidine kinase
VTVAGFALARLLSGSAPIELAKLTAAVEAYQAIIGIVGVSLLVLAAMTSERARAEANAAERARLEEQTRRAVEREHEAVGRLMELDELKTTFLHAVSHDLRTPLASILGIGRTLEREDLAFAKEEVRDLAARIVRNARRLHKLVSDLLDYERLERGALGAEPSATDLGELVRAVADEVDLRDHPLHVEADSVTVSVDATQVERIVDNLLVNAINHTPPGTDIWLRVSENDDKVLLTVEDSGVGVPESEREAIFSPLHPSSPRPEHARHGYRVGPRREVRGAPRRASLGYGSRRWGCGVSGVAALEWSTRRVIIDRLLAPGSMPRWEGWLALPPDALPSVDDHR